MNTVTRIRRLAWIRSAKHVLGILTLLLPLILNGGGVVTDCTEANLRAAMAAGGSVTFACNGTITVAATITNSTDTALDGSGRQITISGGNAVRVLYVTTNTTLRLINLVVANGRDTNGKGGGIFVDGGNVTLLGTTMQSNLAISLRAQGGAVYNYGGLLNATNCTFRANLAQSITNNPSGEAAGGAVYSGSGTVNLEGCVLHGNNASAALDVPPYDPLHEFYPALSGSNGLGGAICNLGGTLRVNACTFRENSASGGRGGYGRRGQLFPGPGGDAGGNGGQGKGGAIFNSGLASVAASTFFGNQVTGGTDGTGGFGGPGGSGGSPGGFGGSGGNGFGAALFNSDGVVSLVNCTAVSNLCNGGNGGSGGGWRLIHRGVRGRWQWRRRWFCLRCVLLHQPVCLDVLHVGVQLR